VFKKLPAAAGLQASPEFKWTIEKPDYSSHLGRKAALQNWY
jgi:hypothetical protein